MEELQNQYGDKGLLILTFPCNQFGGQEPLPNNEIKAHMEKKAKIKIQFQMFQKVHVNGPQTCDIYKFLRCNSSLYNESTKESQNIPWNFAKFLLNSEGKVVKYALPNVEPKSLEDDIKNLL